LKKTFQVHLIEEKYQKIDNMRIQATVKLTNRDVNMSTKPVRTSIALGKKPLAKLENSSDPKVFMMLCTAANRAGTKFNVCANIDRVFDKFVDQGKCTIQLKKPAKTIFISDADPLQLKSLLNLLKRVLFAKNDEELDKISITSAALMGASLSQVTKPKEKLVIVDKKEYPITKNFPSSLTELKVNNINLKKFDSRMLKLSRLVVLDLSDNNISIWPESFSGLANLKELYLSNNKLATVPVSFFQTVSEKLCLLDLSSNQLNMIPFVISKLKNLVTLRLKDNGLKRLPVTISNLKNLKMLELVGNPELGVVPGSFLRLRLDHLSMSSKCLTTDVSGLTIRDTSSEMPSLADLCLVNLTKSGSRSKIDETCLPMRLLEYWDTMQTCSCGKLCLWSSHVRGLIKTNPSRISQNFITDGNLLGSQAFLRCETLFCSKKCIELYKNQPLNFR